MAPTAPPHDLMAQLGREFDPRYAANKAEPELQEQERREFLEGFHSTVKRLAAIFQESVDVSTESVKATLKRTLNRYGKSTGLDVGQRSSS